MKTAMKFALSAAVWAATLGGAQAAVVGTITSITGKWTTATGASVTGLNTDTIRWGGSTPRSRYEFDPASPLPTGIVPNGPTFDLGDFTHVNNPIQPPSITGATLKVDVALDLVDTDTSSTISKSVTSVFDFTHNETSNVAGTCPPGSGSVCDDIVTLAFNSLGSDSVDIGGVEYFFNIVGFSTGGAPFASFLTQEGESNTATLVAELTSTPTGVVPVPAALPLLATALGLTGLFGRKRRAA